MHALIDFSTINNDWLLNNHFQGFLTIDARACLFQQFNQILVKLFAWVFLMLANGQCDSALELLIS